MVSRMRRWVPIFQVGKGSCVGDDGAKVRSQESTGIYRSRRHRFAHDCGNSTLLTLRSFCASRAPTLQCVMISLLHVLRTTARLSALVGALGCAAPALAQTEGPAILLVRASISP